MFKRESNPIVFILVSEDLCLDSVSPENLQVLRERLGWEIKPRAYLPDLLDESIREYFVEQLKRGFSGECFYFDFLFPFQQTKTKSSEILVTPSHTALGKVTKVGLAIRFRDQFYTLFQNIPGLVIRYMMQADGVEKMLYVSESVQIFCGVSAREVLEDENRIWSKIAPDHIEGFRKSLRTSFQTLAPWEAEWAYHHPDGTVHWHRGKGNPKRTQDGSVIWDSIIFDVTQEKLAKIALVESEKRFKTLIKEGVEMVAILNSNGEYTYNSPSYQTMLGYSVEELLGLQAFSLIHPDNVPRLYSEFEQVFSTKKAYFQPYRIRRKDGSYIWLKSVGTNLLDDPAIQGIVVNSSDITELIQVESDLKVSEQQYKYLFENSPGAMMIWELESGQILDINERACQLYGYSREEFLSLTVYDIRPSEEVIRIKRLSHEENWITDSGLKLYHGISLHSHKSGELLDIEVNAQMIGYQGKRVSLVLLLDVTEKLKAQRELLVSEEKYRSVFNLSPLPKLIYRRDTLEIVDINEVAIQSYGYSRAEFLDLTPLDLLPGANREDFIQVNQEEVPFGKIIKYGVHVHQRKKGELIHVEITGLRFHFQGLDCMMMMANDVSEKVLTDQLENLGIELMEEVILEKSLLKGLLNKFLVGLEEAIPGIRTSILLVHEGRIQNLTSPRIADSYLDQISGIQIGPLVGTCGAAAFYGSRMVTEDISSDPVWADYADLALSQGFRSCLSLPLFNSEKKVIATFGVYFLERKSQESMGIERFQPYASLISLVLENHAKKEALKLSNERYEYVNMATKDALYDWDVREDKLYWGKSYVRFLGSEKVFAETQVHNWADIVHPEDRERVMEILKNDLSNPEKDRFQAEYQIRKNDGSYVYVIDRAVIVREESGKAIRMVGVLSDVTQQRLEELRLKLLESVITNANDAVIITEAEPFSEPGPRIVYVNEAFTRMTGYLPEEVLGKTPRILQGPKTNQSDLDVLRKAMKNWQPCEVTTVNYRKDGEEFWTNFSISPVADSKGWFTHWISIQREVTEQKTEEQKRELLAQIVHIFGEESRFNFALDRSLEQLVKFKELDAGEIWLVNSDKTKLNLVSRYALTDAGTSFFAKADRKVNFKKGLGIPGKTWEKGEIVLEKDFETSENLFRKRAFIESGLKSAFGIPLQNNGQVIGVMLFAATEQNGMVQSASHVFNSMSQVLGAEISRKKVEDELSQIFDTAQDIICIMGFDGKFKKVNRGAVYLLGYTEEELLSYRYDQFLHPEDRREFEEELKNLTLGQNLVHLVNRFFSKDGEVIWLDWNSTVVMEEELIYSVAKNVTEEKHLENLLESANQMARIGFWDVNIEEGHRNQYWSPVTKEIFEVAPNYTPDVSEGFRFFSDEAIPVISESFTRCANTGEPYDLELPARTESGKGIWIRVIGQAEFRNGVCIRVYGTIQDITNLKVAQLELEKSFEQKNAILESIGDAFFSVDHQGIMTYWNQKAFRLFGGDKKEMVGRSIWEMFPLASEKALLEKLRESEKSGEVLRFEQFFGVIGKWLEISVYPSEIGLSVYLRDVTIRKTTEELIRQSNERFENATKATRDAIYEHDLQTDELFWGEGFRTLFGYEVKDGIHSFENWYSKIHSEDMDEVLSKILEAYSDSSIVNIQYEYRFLKTDGSYAFVADRGMIIRDSTGKAIRVVGAISDITERKDFESSLKNLNEKLEVRARELAASNAELEQFAYVASHDLQEPLRMVTSFLSQLETKYEDQLDDRAKKYIYFAVDGAKRMRQIILDLLEFSRVGRMEEEVDDLALSGILEEVCTLQSNLIQTKNAKISFGKLPVIKGARTPMIQVFQNLISNALKYSREDVAPVVTVSYRELSDFWEFSVEDNGIGMDADSYEKIFVIFQRLHTKDQFSGSGIGLAIVKKIVENLGGRIWVESELGLGSTFRFTLKK